LIIGDITLKNNINWELGTINLSFPEIKREETIKPEIRHVMRQPESRPSSNVSQTFSILIVLPLFLFVFGVKNTF
jgi:oligosaccharyltransferase complex subunit delta (ribophorin II)